ncbi:MAG: hypothetical protein ACQEQ2_00480 [Pseudomonadota bacterium]
MTLYPYSKIKTEKFGLLLFAARATTIIGLLILLFSIGFILLIFFTGGTHSLGDGVTISSPRFGIPSILTGVWGFASCIFFLLIGGVAAAVVSLENQFSKYINNKENKSDA